MKQALNDIKRDWFSYRSGKTTDKLHQVHNLVVKVVPEIIESWVEKPDRYKFIGSDGQGNILKAPWFATLNTEVTTSATKGYYLVYCVHEDFSKIYLTIGFGATQFSELYGKGKIFFEKTEQAVANMRINTERQLTESLDFTKGSTSKIKPNLTETGDFNLKAYESCCIYSLEYSMDNLPDEKVLRRDYLEYLQLYDAMVDSLLLPDVEDYVLESIERVPDHSAISLLEFKPRPSKKQRNSSTAASSASEEQARRRSKSAHKIGLLGEQVVFDFEKDSLSKGGRTDLASKVILHRDYSINRTPGWDISSFEKDGTPKYIEVKSSNSSNINEVEFTPNEWKMAQQLGDSYEIYLVSKVLTDNASIEVIKNPAKFVEQGKINIGTSLYLLNFQTEQNDN
jgi:hypothetical protein